MKKESRQRILDTTIENIKAYQAGKPVHYTSLWARRWAPKKPAALAAVTQE